MVGCGAKVLGPVRVGDNCKIAANAVLLQSIDADSTAVGVPARVVRVSNVKLENERPVSYTHLQRFRRQYGVDHFAAPFAGGSLSSFALGGRPRRGFFLPSSSSMRS